MSFNQREIVWAKPTGYPWWPAIISKLPENNDGNFKVLFIGEDNYAILDPRGIRKYEQHYQQLSKNKTKKLQLAIVKADIMLKNKKNNEPKNKKVTRAAKIAKNDRKKVIKEEQLSQKNQQQKWQEQDNNEDQSNNKKSEQNSEESVSDLEEEFSKKKQQSFTPNGPSDEFSLEKELKEVNRQKIQTAQAQLNQIVVQFQTNRANQWNHREYFQNFNCQFLTCDELLQSNLTRMLKYIIIQMQQHNYPKQYINPVESISTFLKKKIYDYLSNTSYYDQYLKVYDKNKQNQVEAESLIIKIIKKQNNSLHPEMLNSHVKIKKQNINLFAELIGQEIGKGGIFKTGEFMQDLKENKIQLCTKLTSKAATQRFSEQIIKKYI